MFARLSIRARITLGSVAVATILLILALTVVRGEMRRILIDADQTLAISDLTPFIADITLHPTESVDDPGTGVLLLVRDPSGGEQVNTLPHDVHEAILKRAADATSNETSNETSNAETTTFTTTAEMSDDEGRSFVIATSTISTSAGDWMLWSARSMSSSELALRGLDRVLIIAAGVLVLGLGLASWLLASVALRPVTAMRRKAEEFSTDTAATLPVAAARDELSALATTLNAFLSRMRASTEREKQMVSDAAHELRTPLAALTTQLELAHADFGDAAALAGQLTSAEASVHRLTALATNMLELSRLETELSVTPSSAATLCDEFTASIDRARLFGVAKDARVEFVISISDESALFSIATQSFGRLVDNLLTNAITAIAVHGSVTATLSNDTTDLCLDVVDDGPGMPEQFIAVAFDRFSRPDVSRTESTGGSGLGLALVHAIAVAAGGSAVITNTGGGLRVSVRIPEASTGTE